MNKEMKDYLFDRMNSIMNFLDEIMDEVSKWEIDATPDEEDDQ